VSDFNSDKNVTDHQMNLRQKPRIKLLGRSIPLPASIFWRRILGVLLILGGIFSFLPVLGVWMLPLGLLVLSHDSKHVRQWRRKAEVSGLRRWRRFRNRSKDT
jgi:hypothetical protein